MSKTIRNILIVSLFAVGGGWLGIWLNSLTGNTQPPMQSLGALVWLTTPALAGLALRAFGGDGWKDAGLGLNLRRGWKGYIVAVLVYPLAGLLVFGLGSALGVIDAGGFAAQGFGAYISAAGVMFAGSLVKNLFEEFAWRGYLTPRLDAARVHPMLNHLIVGLVWMTWHLPYYHYYLDRNVLESATSLSLPAFILTGYLVMIPTAILFGELRLWSKSVWPVFLLHQVINALSMPLLINGFIKVNGPAAALLTPTNEGIAVALLFGVAGWLIYRARTKQG